MKAISGDDEMTDENPKVYRVKGRFLMGESQQPFTIEMVSMNPDQVKEKVYSDIGSRHRVRRRDIQIHSVEEIDSSESEDPTVRYITGD